MCIGSIYTQFQGRFKYFAATTESQLNVIVNETAQICHSKQMANKLFQEFYHINRNNQIAQDIAIEVNKGQKCLVLTERKEHAEILNLYLNCQLKQ